MEIIDTQLHEIGPQLRWDIPAGERFPLFTEITLAWMDAVGVDIAILDPLGHRPEWSTFAITQFPRRFAGVVGVGDFSDPNLEETVAALRSSPNILGTRIGFGISPDDPTGEIGLSQLNSGKYNRLFAACEKHDVPVFCFASGAAALSAIPRIVDEHPGITIIIDHMGMPQPPTVPLESPLWASLSTLCEVAQYEQVALKFCGFPVYAKEPYPYADVWPQLHEIINAFHPERVMWASDIGRFQGRIGWDNATASAHGPYGGKHTYAESLFAIRETDELSTQEKKMLLGGAARSVLHWPADKYTDVP